MLTTRLKLTQKVSKTLVFPLLNSMTQEGPTDRPTDRPTDGAGCRVACTRLKNNKPNWPTVACSVL